MGSELKMLIVCKNGVSCTCESWVLSVLILETTQVKPGVLEPAYLSDNVCVCVCEDVSSSRMCSSSLPSNSPVSVSGQNTSADVAALIQQAAAQAASRNNSSSQQASASDRRSFHSRQNSMNFIQVKV